MIDGFGRNINKLRVSVTSACDLACQYCVEGLGILRKDPDQLEWGQQLRLIELLVHHVGISSIRFTGGEPLLFRDLPRLVEGVAKLGIESIGLTTNGQWLAKKVVELRQAGLSSVNVSLDSLQPDNFRRLARTGTLKATLQGVEAAAHQGIPIKINMVVMKGENDHEIVPMLEYGLSVGAEVRYLELMKMGPLFPDNLDKLMPMAEILQAIGQRYTFRSQSAPIDSTALRFKVLGGSFGVIANESAPFCATCSRLRLTSTGKLVGCLSNAQEVDLRHLLTTVAPEKELQSLTQLAVSNKRNTHFIGSSLRMSNVGG